MKKKYYLKLIGPLLLVIYLIYFVDIKNVLSQIKNIKFNFIFIIPILFYPLIFLIKSIRGKLVTSFIELPSSFFNIFKMYYLCMYFSLFINDTISNFARISAFPKKYIKKVLLFTFVDAFTEAISLIFFILICWIFYYKKIFYYDIKIIYYFIFLFISFIFISEFFLWLNRKIKIKIKKLEKIRNKINTINFKLYIKIFSITVFITLFHIFFIYIIFKGLHYNISFLQTLIMMILVRIGNSLPITTNGIGMREAIFIYFFHLFHIGTKENAIFIGIILLFYTIIWKATGLFFYLLPNNEKK